MRGRYPLGALRAYTARRASLRVRFTRRIWGICGSGSRTGKFEAGAIAEEVTPKRPCSSYLHGGSSTSATLEVLSS